MPTTEVTVEFWQRVHSAKQQSTFCLDPDLGTNRFQAYVPWQDGVVYWDFGNINASGRLSYTPPDSILGTWQHFALVASGANSYMAIYRNGILEAFKTSSTGWTSNACDLVLGWNKLSNVFFDGELDEFRIWNVARSAAQIRLNQFQPLRGDETNLVAYYRLDEGAGTTTADATGHGAAGTFASSPAWMPGARPVLDQVTSWQPVSGTNLVLNLDGVDDHVRVPAGIWFSNEFTIETWVYERSYNSWSRVLDFGNGEYSDNVALTISEGATGRPDFRIFRGATRDGIEAPDPLPLNQWVHLAATLRSNTATLYINGVAVVSGTVPGPPLAVIRTNNYIGRGNWASDAYANALYEDLRIWNVARTPAQLRQFMTEPVAPGDPNLLLNYRFDEPSGLTALDSRTTSPQNGTLTNGASRLSSQARSITPAACLKTPTAPAWATPSGSPPWRRAAARRWSAMARTISSASRALATGCPPRK
jgi:hypothetical protein